MSDPTPRRLTAAELESLSQRADMFTHMAVESAEVRSLLAERTQLRTVLRDLLTGCHASNAFTWDLEAVARAQALLEEA